MDGDPTTGSPDEDVTVEYTYNADGRVLTLTAKQQNPADDQTTTYEYGVTTGGGSALDSNDLLARVIYPDSADSSDNVEYQYNRQGQVIQMRDQNGSVHSYDFDKLGRQTQDRVTTLGTDVDGAVRRIGTSYDKLGRVEKVTSYDNATFGSGNVVNEVQSVYDDFSQLTAQYQAHGGAVNMSTSPKVQYDYADGSANQTRPTSVTYPGGRVVRYEYASGDDEALSRISYLADDASGSVGTHLAEYSYLGLSMVVKVDYPEPVLTMDLAAGSGLDPYTGLDRFDRVVDLRWIGASTDAVRIKHGYDRASNRLWREDVVAKSQITPVYLDEYYTYDGMYQLTAFDRGELNSGHTGISGTPSREEDWTLDALGNWDGYVQKAGGTTSLDQARTVNLANEITGITETVGPAWPMPAYDRNGNSTSFPQPVALTSGYDATYDAWNRLVRLEDGADTVQENEYDGQNWRTVTKLYAGGTLSQTVHQYYSSGWQLPEERVDSATTPDRQFVWGLRYVDDLVLRERDTDGSGSVDEQLYSLQDANWNVVAVSDASGAVQERYSYTPYGAVTKLSPTFGSSAATIEWNEILYAGYRYDSDAGLYYVRYRYYHPELGRWVSKDPLMAIMQQAGRPTVRGATGWQAEINPYRYVLAIPLMATDPSGLACTVTYDCVLASGDEQVLAEFKVPIADLIKQLPIFKEPPVKTGGPTGKEVVAQVIGRLTKHLKAKICNCEYICHEVKRELSGFDFFDCEDPRIPAVITMSLSQEGGKCLPFIAAQPRVFKTGYDTITDCSRKECLEAAEKVAQALKEACKQATNKRTCEHAAEAIMFGVRTTCTHCHRE